MIDESFSQCKCATATQNNVFGSVSTHSPVRGRGDATQRHEHSEAFMNITSVVFGYDAAPVHI